MKSGSVKRRKTEKSTQSTDEKEELLGNRIDDVRWLCSLTESEIDFLISLKKLMIRRAEVVGLESTLKKFDLKMLRVVSFTLMENLKQEIKSSKEIKEPEKSSACLEQSNLLKVKVSEKFEKMEAEELMMYFEKKDTKAELNEDFESMLDEEMMGIDENDDGFEEEDLENDK